jgi:hypothetical protein
MKENLPEEKYSKLVTIMGFVTAFVAGAITMYILDSLV